MKVIIGNEYVFNHKEGNVLEKYDNTKCKVISRDSTHQDMFSAKMCDGRKFQVYAKELSR